MTKSKLIVVWGSEGILSSAIEFFLAIKADWKVVRVSNGETLDALIAAVERAQPDIVIVIRETQLHTTDVTLRLLRDHPAIRVIHLSLANNQMEVYSKQKFITQEASDLISVIERE